jgi:hypothetical protein
MPHLIVPSATFYSQTDEASFFAWLKSIPGVTSVVGDHRGLVASFRSSRLSKVALWDLLALYFRYDLPMQSLARFETPQNRAWFCKPEMFWHKRVFGKGPRMPKRKL